MGQPSRLPEIRLPWEKLVIYFVTLCVKDRREVLANTKVFEAMEATIAPLRKWRVLAGVIMPDHAHWIVSPIGDRERSVGDCSDRFKRVLRKTLGSQQWNGSADVLIASCVPREPAQQMDLHTGQSCAAWFGPKSARLAVLFRFH